MTSDDQRLIVRHIPSVSTVEFELRQQKFLLPILAGAGTRFTERLHTAPKVYAAFVRFGTETDTDDRDGKATRTAPPPSRADAESALAGFRGLITQTPPDYAAVKVGGRPAYARARAGETLTLAARQVQVNRLDVTRWSSDAELGLRLRYDIRREFMKDGSHFVATQDVVDWWAVDSTSADSDIV